MADKFTRTDDSFPSHPGRPFSYPDARTPERNITEEGVTQYTGAVIGGEFSLLTNVLYSDVTNQVQFGWTWSGPTAAFNVYVSENGGAYALAATTASGAGSYLYTSAFDITSNHADPSFAIAFYLEAVIGSTRSNLSVPLSATYNHV